MGRSTHSKRNRHHRPCRNRPMVGKGALHSEQSPDRNGAGENESIGVWVSNAWSNGFAYDGKLRRRIDRQYTYLPSSGSYLLTNEVHFIYDGNIVVEERNASNIPLVSYTRGNDLSGTLRAQSESADCWRGRPMARNFSVHQRLHFITPTLTAMLLPSCIQTSNLPRNIFTIRSATCSP